MRALSSVRQRVKVGRQRRSRQLGKQVRHTTAGATLHFTSMDVLPPCQALMRKSLRKRFQ